MTQPNWGLLQSGGFENALATGMAMGADLRQRREEKEFKNALTQYDPDNPDTLKPIMATRPDVGLKLREEVRERQTARDTAELTQKALSGDTAALQQLATVNFDRWKALDTNQKASAKQEAEVFGNAAIDILNRPAEQRGQAIQAYAQQLGQQYPEVMQLLQLPPDQQEMALRSAVAEAGIVKSLIEMEQPRYQAIPEGGTLVDTRNPQAVQSYMQGMGGAVPPPPPGFQLDQGGQTATPSATFSGSFRPAGVNQAGVTSTYRTPEHNRRVGGVANSYHTRRGVNGEPLAVDSVPPAGMSMSAYAAKLRQLNPGLDVINEGDHVHIEPRG